MQVVHTAAATATGRPIARESDRDLEALPTVYTVHGKVPSVSREDNVRLQVFSENNQRGVCEVHRAIRILHHELARAAEGRGACRHKHRATRQHEVQTGNAAAGHPRQKVRCLRQDCLSGDRFTLPGLKKPDKFPVTTLAAVEQRDQGARVQEQFTWHAAAIPGYTRDASRQDRLRPSPPNR